jgi:FkbM family methyltransferase
MVLKPNRLQWLKDIMNFLTFLLYPLTSLVAKVLCSFVPTLHKIRLNFVWRIILYILPRQNHFVKSVYGPWLQKRISDHQFYLCATGKSGFKLSSIISKLDRNVKFIDIGANVGLYSLIAEENPNICNVIAIEPNPIAIESLTSNIRQNSAKKIDIVQGAVAKGNDEITLHYNSWHIGMGSTERIGEHSLKVRSLNREFFDKIFAQDDQQTFVKIDVEGAEHIVIAELFESRLASQITDIFLEITPKWLSQDDVEFIYSTLNLNGFKLFWRSSGQEQYDAHFVKSETVLKIDAANRALRSAKEVASNQSKIKYSVCVPNYNMGDTIYDAIQSVAVQLDERFEILIIDDGSNDNSKDEIKKLEQKYSIVRSVFLARDKKRYLGETRNLSIYAARGEYVLLHIDADDIWEAYIKDFVKLFHSLEETYGFDFLLVGQQTGIVKRELMLRCGGYDNIYRGEDRNLMFKLAAAQKILFLDYKTFRTRMIRPKKKQFFKTIWDTWSHLQYDLLSTFALRSYVLDALLFSYKEPAFTVRFRILRSALVLPALAFTTFKENLRFELTWEEFQDYRDEKRGTYEMLMKKRGMNVDLKNVVSEGAVTIFSHQLSGKGFKGE